MEAFTEAWGRIGQARRIALFLDFDGTLAPIVPEPSQASLPAGVRESLELLVSDPDVKVSIISGRSIDDLKERLGVSGLILAGNHGLEIAGPDFNFADPVAESSRKALNSICEALTNELRDVPGVIVENKGLSASVHFRLTPPAEVARIPLAVAAAGTIFKVRPGKKVLEILPRTPWNKGSAVLKILDSLQTPGLLPICFGDDVTDEDAFRALPDAITVQVGCGEAASAHYRVSGPHDVANFLDELIKFRAGNLDQ